MTAKLTDVQRRMIARAREVAALKDTDAMRERYGVTDGTMARADTLGEAQFLLGELAAIITRLAWDSTDG